MTSPDWQSDELARAEMWRIQQRQRWDYQYGLWRALAGSRTAMRALLANYQALIEASAEAQSPSYPGNADPDVDPMGQSDTVNIGL